MKSILRGQPLHFVDTLDPDVHWTVRSVAERLQIGAYSQVLAPMVWEDQPVGFLYVIRKPATGFSDKEIALLETFADQAVIAIQNARMFNELQTRNKDLTESLEQRTAMSEILRVISQSQTDVQPVFEAIARNARKLCEGTFGVVATFDGNLIHIAALEGFTPEGTEELRRSFPMRPGKAGANQRAILTRTVAHVPDVAEDPEYKMQGLAQVAGYRSIVAVPMLRDGRPIGSISIAGAEPGMFSERQIAMLQTFADQAVIAIENTRLFNETQEALEQQKAAAEILSVISSSVSDTKPVFDKILESCKHLFGSDEMDVLLVDDQGQLQIAAYVGKVHDAVAATFPAPVEKTPAGRAIRERRVVHYPDVIHGADVPNVVRQVSEIAGYQSMAFAPMLWEGRGIGAIGVARSSGAYTRKGAGAAADLR